MKYLPLLLILFSCNKLTEGDVVAKTVIPAHDYIYMQPIPHFHSMRVGKVSTMSVTYTYIPQRRHVGEQYQVTITGVHKGDTLTESFYLSHDRYMALRQGDHMCVDGECHTPNPNP